ncbi:uncharacterized protein [Procambarus clarkii]|uniref:uncharacterized protein n=1 Tax=Procambarus clarkii TaxID=6728 RepID=UPI003743C097
MVFFLRQLQEKYREQKQPLFVTFIDLMKAFDLVSRDCLFKILSKIGCPPSLLSNIRSFHKNMKGTVVFDGLTSDAFDIRSRIKQGCIKQNPIRDFFHSFAAARLRICHGRHLPSNQVGWKALQPYQAESQDEGSPEVSARFPFLHDDDAAVTAHSAEDFQRLMTHFSEACQAFGLTISLKKIQVMRQGVDSPPDIGISDYKLEIVHDFVYL